MKQKPIVLNRDRDVTLTPYLTSTDKTTAILICPAITIQIRTHRDTSL